MSERRRFRVLTGLLLGAPLAVILAVLVAGGLRRSFGPGGASSASPAIATMGAPPELPGLGRAEADLPPDRFWERVDGAADALIAAGCTRLLVWRTTEPAAEAEVLLFQQPDGAARTLVHDAGTDRTPGPGDEASVSDQVIFFRRGRIYVRVMGDTGAPPDPARLLLLARKMDSVIPVLAGGGSS